MTHMPLQELIIEAADRLAKNTSRILEYVNRGERPPEQLTEERDRLVAELMALDEERRNGNSK